MTDGEALRSLLLILEDTVNPVYKGFPNSLTNAS
jgi:hypothetical protein